MSLIRWVVIALPLEHMSKMTPTIRTHNLSSLHPERAISVTSHSTWDTVEIGGPSTAGLEFVFRCVERFFAAGAGVHALFGHVLVVFAGKGGLCSLFS